MVENSKKRWIEAREENSEKMSTGRAVQEIRRRKKHSEKSAYLSPTFSESIALFMLVTLP